MPLTPTPTVEIDDAFLAEFGPRVRAMPVERLAYDLATFLDYPDATHRMWAKLCQVEILSRLGAKHLSA